MDLPIKIPTNMEDDLVNVEIGVECAKNQNLDSLDVSEQNMLRQLDSDMLKKVRKSLNEDPISWRMYYNSQAMHQNYNGFGVTARKLQKHANRNQGSTMHHSLGKSFLERKNERNFSLTNRLSQDKYFRSVNLEEQFKVEAKLLEANKFKRRKSRVHYVARGI